MLLEIYNLKRRQQIPISNNKVNKGMFFKPPEQYQLLKWVQSLVTTRSVNNFKEDWRDGIVLCALIEGISPGACPRYDVLHPKQEQLNIELGLRLAETHLGLFSELTVTEILNMDDGTATKLQHFVAQLHSVYQLISGMNPKPCCLPLSVRTSDLEWKKTIVDHPNCFAKGMGLLMAVKGKAASFNIYLQTYEFMDIVIEIKGRENEDYCTERITLRSPRKKELIKQPSAPCLTPLANGKIINIPLEYAILSRKIVVTYVPPSAGLYELSIISRGQHIFGSPFEVRIDNVSNDICNTSAFAMPLLGSLLPHQDSDEVDATTENKLSMQFLKTVDTSPNGLVKKRKLVKTTVLREYAMIELQPGEPLPQDPRAWSALTTEPSILLNSRDEVQRYPLVRQIECVDELANGEDTLCMRNTSDTHEISNQEHIAEHVLEQTNSTKVDYQNGPDTQRERKEKEVQGIESAEKELTSEEQTAICVNSEENLDGNPENPKFNLEVTTEVCSNEAEQHLEPIEMLRSVEEKQNCTFNGNYELKTSKNIFQQIKTIHLRSKTSPYTFSKDPGFEGKCKNNYLEIEEHHLNGREASEMSPTSIVQQRSNIFNAPNSKAGQGATKGSLLPRVPERLIDEWSDLWTPNGESIVKVRVKEWENFPKI